MDLAAVATAFATVIAAIGAAFSAYSRKKISDIEYAANKKIEAQDLQIETLSSSRTYLTQEIEGMRDLSLKLNGAYETILERVAILEKENQKIKKAYNQLQAEHKILQAEYEILEEERGKLIDRIKKIEKTSTKKTDQKR